MSTLSALLLYCLLSVQYSDPKMGPVRTYKNTKDSTEKPGKSSYPLSPEKKTSGACQALQGSRIAPGPRPMCPAGLRMSTTQRLPKKWSYEEICSKKYEKKRNITIYTRLPFGVLGVPLVVTQLACRISMLMLPADASLYF